ncbi:SDR family oxidoreductase [Paracoccus sp. N5]|uniref:SDR family oxidoreductase n=1 Tax=Paracoccus sp. N5 TaxID=1101189 RepID=UPI00038034D6|nr:SDR family oxidoreductase [Paracoccus sp. N5]
MAASPAPQRLSSGWNQPVGCVGQPDDIADVVPYLASDEAQFVTGAELVIDGGFTAM